MAMRWLPLFLAFFIGCSAQAPRVYAPQARPAKDSAAAKVAVGESETPTQLASIEKPLPAEGTFARKIIYTATVNVVVEDFTPIPAEVDALASRLGGYVSHSKITGSPGSARTGTWTLRVPAERYAECLTGARSLGEVRNVNSDSQDVSEEFYDIEARIKNKKLEEDRLLKLLENATGKLDQILAVERELSRVRGEIEQMEGRKRVLTHLIDLSTVNVNVEEIKGYVPEESPTYLTRVRRTFEVSLTTLVTVATECSIIFVALSPWLAIALPLAILVWLFMRRQGKR